MSHKQQIDAVIARVLDSGHYILGREVSAFESAFARYLGVPHALGVGSGTDALQVALRACEVKAGDSVVTVSHTAVATVAAIELAAARPLLVDIEPKTYTINCNKLEDALRRGDANRVKAIIVVHLYGHPADMSAVMQIAMRFGLRVVEDYAQSHGASVAGRQTGTWGDVAAFSFYPTKNLGALGDGGAVATSDASIAERARLLREYGWRARYVSDIAGMNTRLDEIQAAVLHVKLAYLDAENARRRSLAQLYDDRLVCSGLSLPAPAGWARHVYHQYVIRCAERDALRAYLKERGVGTLVHYPVPIHLQPAYRGRIEMLTELPETEAAAREVLSLPMYPELGADRAEAVASLLIAAPQVRR